MTDSTSLPRPPAVAAELLGKQLPLMERYAAWLSDAGVVRGLIGPREVPRLWDRHLLNCAVLGELLPSGATVADVGSGAGLPGLVLAITRSDLTVTLIEPLLRRTTFLSEVVDDLGLSNVVVVRARADALHGVQQFDVVTSRAVAPLDRLLEWSMPLVRADGALVAMKGSSVAVEIEAARPTLERLACAEPEVTILGEGQLSSTTVAVRVAWADPARVPLLSAQRSASPEADTRSSRDRRVGGGTATARHVGGYSGKRSQKDRRRQK